MQSGRVVRDIIDPSPAWGDIHVNQFQPETMSTSPERDKEGLIESGSTLSNELAGNKKRSSSEIAEYPRRRATIAVCIFYNPFSSFAFLCLSLLTMPLFSLSSANRYGPQEDLNAKVSRLSVKYVVYEKQGAMELGQNVSSAQI
jgi:hypothetical protein